MTDRFHNLFDKLKIRPGKPAIQHRIQLVLRVNSLGVRRCTMMYDVVSGSNPLGMP